MLNRIKKAIAAAYRSFKEDMSFDEHAVYVRTDLLKAVELNDQTIKEIENIAIQPKSEQMKIIDGFLGKCLELKLGPVLFSLYKEDKNKKIPGLNIDIVNTGDVGTGEFRQNIKITMHKQYLGELKINTMMDRDSRRLRMKVTELLPK